MSASIEQIFAAPFAVGLRWKRVNKQQLKWQCRRGMRELDVLLQRYLEHRYDNADDAEKAAFCEVLTLADPELNRYLLQQQKPSSESIAHVIRTILSLPARGA